MKPFVLNRHGRLVFPSNFIPELDFSVIETLEQLDAVIRATSRPRRRRAPRSCERVEPGGYADRATTLMRDLALNLFWVQPLRDDDVREAADPLARRAAPPRRRLPAGPDAVGGRRAQGRRRRATATPSCPPTWDAEAEDRIFAILFDVFRHSAHHATELPADQADRGGDR